MQHYIATGIKKPKILISSIIRLDSEGNSARNKAKDFELRGPSLSGILPPLNDPKNESHKKSISFLR